MKRFFALVLVCLLACASPANADEGWSVQIGGTYQFAEEGYTDGRLIQVDYNLHTDLRLSAGWVSQQVVSESNGYQWSVSDYFYVTGQSLVTFRQGHWLRPFVGFGVSLHPQRFPILGGWGSFTTSLGVNLGDNLFLEVRHNSTASITTYNFGQDTVQIGYRF